MIRNNLGYIGAIVICVCMIVAAVCTMTGCSEKTMSRNYGGTTTIDLEPGQKLEEITWKDNNIWYLTRPMQEDEVPETHTFQEDSEFGMIEGTVVIQEH